MATGNYGIKRPADVSPNDIDMYVHYAPSAVDKILNIWYNTYTNRKKNNSISI